MLLQAKQAAAGAEQALAQLPERLARQQEQRRLVLQEAALELRARLDAVEDARAEASASARAVQQAQARAALLAQARAEAQAASGVAAEQARLAREQWEAEEEEGEAVRLETEGELRELERLAARRQVRRAVSALGLCIWLGTSAGLEPSYGTYQCGAPHPASSSRAAAPRGAGRAECLTGCCLLACVSLRRPAG